MVMTMGGMRFGKKWKYTPVEFIVNIFPSTFCESKLIHAYIYIYIYILKPLFKTSKQNQETEKCFLFYSIIRHTSCFQSWLTLLQPSARPNHLHCVLNCIIKTIPISQRLRLLKIANHILFSVFFFQIYSLSVEILRKILVSSIHL